ncbi:MAG: hypothetical protein K5892_03055 [Acholeplasmatales bacterium]|nr:hypothetical protein [Acholeplasmatales bacterium]
MKKNNEPAMDRNSFNYDMNNLAKTIRNEIDDIDEQIEEEMETASDYLVSKRTSEYERCKSKINRLINSKLFREGQLDKIEMTRDKINAMYTDMELARTVGKVYSGFSTFASNKEVKEITKELVQFNKMMQQTSGSIEKMMAVFTSDIQQNDYTTEVDASLKERSAQMNEDIFKEIEEKAEAKRNMLI